MEVLKAQIEISLNVEDNDTFRNVKEKIAEEVGISPNQQRLIYSNLEFLEDGKTLHDYNVINDPVVSSEKYDLGNTMQILVKDLYGNTFSIDVYPYDTIYHVKEKIKLIDGIPPEKQRLVISRKLLYDEHAISYNIGKQSPIYLLYRLLGGDCVYIYCDFESQIYTFRS